MFTRFADGCHRYGWLINLLISALMFAYFVGGLKTSVEDLKSNFHDLGERIGRIESALIQR